MPSLGSDCHCTIPGTLSDLNLATATENADVHGREKAMRGSGICINGHSVLQKNGLEGCMGTVIKTTVEDGGSVLANATTNQSLSSGVVRDKITHVHAPHPQQ